MLMWLLGWHLSNYPEPKTTPSKYTDCVCVGGGIINLKRTDNFTNKQLTSDTQMCHKQVCQMQN